MSDLISLSRNAFCRSVEELGIDGMAEMYQNLANAGVAGYHFVSNSPNELQQVIGESSQSASSPVQWFLLTIVLQRIVLPSPWLPGWILPHGA